MSYLCTGEKGIPLRDIIKNLGNKNYEYIECRCKWTNDNGKEQDDLYAVMNAVKYLQNVLEDVLGIEATEYSDYLKNDECGRFKLIDTYKENN